jgi:hypothetical protein
MDTQAAGQEAAAGSSAQPEAAHPAPQDAAPVAAASGSPSANDTLGSESCVLKLKGLPYS